MKCEKLSSGSCPVPCGETDGRDDANSRFSQPLYKHTYKCKVLAVLKHRAMKAYGGVEV
jgi:hypothetical protein